MSIMFIAAVNYGEHCSLHVRICDISNTLVESGDILKSFVQRIGISTDEFITNICYVIAVRFLVAVNTPLHYKTHYIHDIVYF